MLQSPRPPFASLRGNVAFATSGCQDGPSPATSHRRPSSSEACPRLVDLTHHFAVPPAITQSHLPRRRTVAQDVETQAHTKVLVQLAWRLDAKDNSSHNAVKLGLAAAQPNHSLLGDAEVSPLLNRWYWSSSVPKKYRKYRTRKKQPRPVRHCWRGHARHDIVGWPVGGNVQSRSRRLSEQLGLFGNTSTGLSMFLRVALEPGVVCRTT